MADASDKLQARHWLEPPLWWKRSRPLRWVVVIAVVGAIAHSLELTRFLRLPGSSVPSFLKGDPHPESAQYTRVAVGVPMVDRFRSYQGVDSVTAELTSAGFNQVSTTSRHAVESAEYPPYGFHTLVVAGYKHLGEEGQLTLQFFNGRLYQAEFVPKDAEDYARRARTLGLERDANARREKVEGDLRLASTVDLAVSNVGKHLRTEPFVLWQDLRLIRERDQWDAKFGAIPKAFVDK